jgi:hypothetical protein
MGLSETYVKTPNRSFFSMFFHHILLIKSARHRLSIQIFQIATEVEEEVMDKKNPPQFRKGGSWLLH